MYNNDMKNTSSGNCPGNQIRKLRLKHNETQKQLGEIIGYGATTVANYESGYRQPDVETLKKIAEHYGVSIMEFL